LHVKYYLCALKVEIEVHMLESGSRQGIYEFTLASRVDVKEEKSATAGAHDFAADGTMAFSQVVVLIDQAVADRGREGLFHAPVLIHQLTERVDFSSLQLFASFEPNFLNAMERLRDLHVQLAGSSILLSENLGGISLFAGVEHDQPVVQIGN